jgi:hypothetical protein
MRQADRIRLLITDVLSFALLPTLPLLFILLALLA